MIYSLSFNLGIPSVTAYNKNGVKIDFNFQKVDNNPANILDIALIVSNVLAVPVTDFVFQAAVPKVGHIDIGRIPGNMFWIMLLPHLHVRRALPVQLYQTLHVQ